MILEPHPRVRIRTEVHKVKLHASHDVWYLGSGPFQDTSFGYESIANQGHRGLANFLDSSVDYQATPHFGLTAYLGVLSGKAGMTGRFNGRKGGFAYLEFRYQF